MGSAQLILLIGGMVLLGLLMLTVNNSFNTKSEMIYYNQAYITGSGIAQSLIDRILTKSFDEKAIGVTVTSPASLTSAYSLGKDAGEITVATFDDADDYKGYIQLDTLYILGVFRTSVDINYTEALNPDKISSNPSFTKRIDIFISNPYLKDVLKFSLATTY